MKAHMSLQKRQILAGIACVLSIGFALWSCLSLSSTSAEDAGTPSVEAQGNPPGPKAGGAKAKDKAKKKPGVRKDVAGAAQADAAKGLRDPFTAVHEGEGETAAVLAAADAAANTAANGSPAAGTDANGMMPDYAAMPVMPVPGGNGGGAGNPPGNTVPAWEAPAPIQQPVLKGIVTGRHGNMALLSDGVTTAAVAPGEIFDGWTLVAVSEAGAEIANDRGGLHLDLAGF